MRWRQRGRDNASPGRLGQPREAETSSLAWWRLFVRTVQALLDVHCSRCRCRCRCRRAAASSGVEATALFTVASAPAPNPASGGARPAVVLLHGILGSHRYLAGLQAALNATGFEVLALDLLGFGRSPWHAEAFDVEAHIAAIRAATGHLGRYLAVGHSLGGLLAKELLLRDAACVGFVSVSTPAFPSLSALRETVWRLGTGSWMCVAAPRWATWCMCTCICQQRWFWRPIAVYLLESPLLNRVMIEGFFDHSHDSFCRTLHDCLEPLSLCPLTVSAFGGRAAFVHGAADRCTPLAELVRKLEAGGGGAELIHVVEGGDHFTVLHHTAAVVTACERLCKASCHGHAASFDGGAPKCLQSQSSS